MLELRELPVFAAPITLIVTVGMFALVAGLHRAEQTIGFVLASFAGFVALFLLFRLIRLRHIVFKRADGSVIIRDRYLTRQTLDRHTFGRDAYAEVVITNDEGDSYQAMFVTPGDALPLTDEWSLTISSRIVIAINRWLAEQVEEA